MREIRTLRAKRRGLETELRLTLGGHEGGKPGYRQARTCGPPRQSSTLPGSPPIGVHLNPLPHLISFEGLAILGPIVHFRAISSGIRSMGFGCSMHLVTLRETPAGTRWILEPEPEAIGEFAAFDSYRLGLSGRINWPCRDRIPCIHDLLTGGQVQPGDLPDDFIKFPKPRSWGELPCNAQEMAEMYPSLEVLMQRGVTNEEADCARSWPEECEGDIWHHWLQIADFDRFRDRGGWDQRVPIGEETSGWEILAWAMEGFRGCPQDARRMHFPDRGRDPFVAPPGGRVSQDEMRATAIRCAHPNSDRDSREKAERLESNWWGQHHCHCDYTLSMDLACRQVADLEAMMRLYGSLPHVLDVVIAFYYSY